MPRFWGHDFAGCKGFVPMQRLFLSTTTKQSRGRVYHPRVPHGTRWNHLRFCEPAPTTPPLFQRVPPWWARWTWALIACDIFLTGSAIELTWNNWYRAVEDPPTPYNTKSSTFSTNEAKTQSTTTKRREPRPTWQRTSLCLTQLALGVGCAVALLVAQRRFVRILAILPPLPVSVFEGMSSSHQSIPGFLGTTWKWGPKPESRVFIQSANNWLRDPASFFPISYCSLEQGRDESELLLRIKDERGHWHIALEGSTVNGEDVGMDMGKAQQAILGAWNGKKIGQFTAFEKMGMDGVLDKRWKSGPVKANR